MSRLAHCRRTLALLTVAMLHVGWGLTVVLDPRAPDRGDAVLYELLPSGVRVVMWLGLAVVVAVLALTRWQALGWALAVIMPMERATGHLWSALMWAIPGEPAGSPLSLAYTVRWLAIAGLIFLAAGMTEKPGREVPRG